MASAVSRVQRGRCVGQLHLQSDDFEGEGDEADALATTYSNPSAYKSMAQDRRRNRAYEHAIASAMKNEKLRSWLEIGPGADILLTKYFIAAARTNTLSSRRLKPLEYVGIEGNETSFKKAVKEMARFLQGSQQPFSYRLLHGHSSKDCDNFRSKIPAKFDLMFSEVFGDILSSEAFPYLLYKARTDDRLIDKNTQILPPFGATLFLPSSVLTSTIQPGVVYVGPRLAYLQNQPTSMSNNFQNRPGVLEFFNFKTMGTADLNQSRTSTFECIKSGDFDSIACFNWVYFDHVVESINRFGDLKNGDPFLNSTLLKEAMGKCTQSIGFSSRENTNFTATNWLTPVILLPRTLPVVVGETVKIDSVARVGSWAPSYQFTVTVGNRACTVDVAYKDIRANYYPFNQTNSGDINKSIKRTKTSHGSLCIFLL